MTVAKLWLSDFRSYETAEIDLAPELTALLGANGQGKTNILEAIGYLATLRSFRGAPTEALVRQGASTAVVRAEATNDKRELLIEAELSPKGRNRIQVNRQKLGRAKDLLGALRVTVFSPDDLAMIKGGPGERRRYLDDTLVSVHPRNHELQADLDKILRQRNALLRQSKGRLTDEIDFTLSVWDAKLVEAGEALAAKRTELVRRIVPILGEAYDSVARHQADVTATLVSEWMDQGLEAALVAHRHDELRRGVTLVGPHRDELALTIGGLPARTHASQGEQRSLALALRLAAHEVVTDTGSTDPILLLDDVFSELDPDRSDALLARLPTGQTVLTSAVGLPAGADPARVFTVGHGSIERS